MSGYWYEPNLVGIPDADDIRKYSVDSQISMDEEIVRSLEGYIAPYNTYTQLHSGLQNPTYKDFFTAYFQTHQELYDRAFVLRTLFDVDLYTGSEDDFYEKVGSILSHFRYILPFYFLPYVNADVSSLRDSDKEHDWVRMVLESIYLQRRWAGSLIGYKLPFKLLGRRASVFLRAQYTTSSILTAFTDKFVRLLDYDSIPYCLPGMIDSSYPDSGYIFGETDYRNVFLDYYKYDTAHTRDELIDSINYLQYDTGLAFGNEGKGLIIDLSLDRILYHLNTIGTYECLVDNDFLRAASDFLRNVRRISDKVMIGSQLTLVAFNDGLYTHVTHPSVPEGGFVEGTEAYIQEQQATYTHPNIKAKFQVFPENYNTDFPISYLRIGTGELDSSIWVSPTDSALLPENYPTDISAPLFQTQLGQYENSIRSGYRAITTTVHPSDFRDKSAYYSVLINSYVTAAADCTETTITLPHQALAPLSSRFLIKLPLDPQTLEGQTDYYTPYTIGGDHYTLTLSFAPSAIDFVTGDPVKVLNVGGSLPTGVEAGRTYYVRKVYEDSYLTVQLYPTAADALAISGTTNVIVLGTDGVGTQYINFGYDGYDRYILITESFNDLTQEYETKLVLQKKSLSGVYIPVNPQVMVDYMQDSSYTEAFTYFPNKADNLILPLPLLDNLGQEKKTMSGNTVYAEIDHLNGTVKFKLKFDPTSLLSTNTTLTYSSVVVSSYSINSLKPKKTTDQNPLDTIVSMREVGFFNSNNQMVAYGTFPPVIYDAAKFHLSINAFLEI